MWLFFVLAMVVRDKAGGEEFQQLRAQGSPDLVSRQLVFGPNLFRPNQAQTRPNLIFDHHHAQRVAAEKTTAYAVSFTCLSCSV